MTVYHAKDNGELNLCDMEDYDPCCGICKVCGEHVEIWDND